MLTLDWLKEKGISPKLADHYVRSGWLHRVGPRAFTVKKEPPQWLEAVFGLQQRGSSLHPGGRTALELASQAHFLPLGNQGPLFLFGRIEERLPAWFKGLGWVPRVNHIRTNFLPGELGLQDHQARDFTVRISAPERAILEFLYEQKIDEAGYEHARLVSEGLGTLRAGLVQELLERCASVKVKRLFLHLAELHRHSWVEQLNLTKVSLGSGKRMLVPGGRLDPKYQITVPAAPTRPADAP